MAGHGELSKDVDIDIGTLISSIWEKKWLIGLVSLIAGALMFMTLSSYSPRYETSIQMILEAGESEFTRTGSRNGDNGATAFDPAAVLSQVQVLLSDDIALATIKKLDLSKKPEFGGPYKPSFISKILVRSGLKQPPLDISPDEMVLEAFKKRLKVYSIDQSRVIEVAYWANDRKLAKQVTDTIADEYLALQRRAKLQTDTSATEFLAPEIKKLREKVLQAEAKIAEFRTNSDILVGTNNSLLATQQLSELSTELSRLRTSRSAAQAKVESVRSTLNVGGSIETIPEVLASSLIQRLRERQVQLRAQISELSITLLPSHPRLKALRSQARDFESQINKEARGILRSLESNVSVLKKQEKSLLTDLGGLKAEAARAGEAEVKLRALERDAASVRTLLQDYETKFREADGRKSSEYLPINARKISSEAHLPTESFFPKTLPFSIAGMVVAAMLGILAVLVSSLMVGNSLKAVEEDEIEYEEEADDMLDIRETALVDNEMNNVADSLNEKTEENAQMLTRNEEMDAVKKQLHAQLDTVQPKEQKQNEVREVKQPEPAVFETPKTNTVAASSNIDNTLPPLETPKTITPPPMDFSMGNPTALPVRNQPSKKEVVGGEKISVSLAVEALLGMGNSRMAILSPGGDKGSITTWLLARKLSKAGKSVVLMDMTGSGITTTRMLENRKLHGIREVLAGVAQLDDIIHRDRLSNVSVLPVGVAEPENPEIALARLKKIVEILSSEYECLIIDCGYADVAGLTSIADKDMFIFISAVGTAQSDELEKELLENGYDETIIVQPTRDELAMIGAIAA